MNVAERILWFEASSSLEDEASLREFLQELDALDVGQSELDPSLAAAILGALEHWMRRLGQQPVGSVESLHQECHRVLEAERRKLELVTSRASSVSQERLLSMLTGYLSTKPAPLFSERLKSSYPERYDQASQAWQARREVRGMPERQAVLDALRDLPQADKPWLRDKLAVYAQEVERFEVERILDQGTQDGILLMAALAAFHNSESLAQPILNLVMLAPEDVAVLAVIAARISPYAASQAFSLLLVETLMGNPEEPQNQWTPRRAETTIVVRSLLPLVGSSIPTVHLDKDHPDAALLDEVRTRTLKTWEAWGEVRGEEG